MIPMRPSPCLLHPCVVVARGLHSWVADAGNIWARATRIGAHRDTVSATDVAEFLQQAEADDVNTLARDGMTQALEPASPAPRPRCHQRSGHRQHRYAGFANAGIRPSPVQSAVSADSTCQSCVAWAGHEGRSSRLISLPSKRSACACPITQQLKRGNVDEILAGRNLPGSRASAVSALTKQLQPVDFPRAHGVRRGRARRPAVHHHVGQGQDRPTLAGRPRESAHHHGPV